ncbi:MAG: carboxypeptidase regulatory-like domain-containing protein, partial [Armatimonadetes bacterium]|nr:carboxypeptidase regulatory-like domain-containing protein [Armatimonadota bacterium]
MPRFPLKSFILTGLLACGPFLSASPAWSGANGDADGNAKVEVPDAVLVLRSAVKLHAPTLYEILRGDLSDNADLDVADAIGILQVVVGMKPAPSPAPLLSFPKIRLKLADSILSPQEKLSFNWEVEDADPSLELQVLLQEPGTAVSALPPNRSLIPGVRPATGVVHSLKADQSWDSAPAPYLKPAVAGSAEAALPNASVGEWRVSAVLKETATGRVAALDSATLLATDKPGVKLSLNRSLANTGDPLRASVSLAGGAHPNLVALMSWLVTPDGRQVSLPGLSPEFQPAYEGPASDAEIKLLDREFGEPGSYRINVRLMERETGKLLGWAEAGFQVCDTPVAVTGVVKGADGQPLGGGTLAYATVEVVDLDDLQMQTAPIKADGTYTLSLPPGRYAVTASIWDSKGRHRAEHPGIFTAACEGTAKTLDLTAAAPTGEGWTPPAAPSPMKKPAPIPLQSSPADCLPKPGVFISYKNNALPPNQAKAYLGDFASFIRRSAGPDVSFLSILE